MINIVIGLGVVAFLFMLVKSYNDSKNEVYDAADKNLKSGQDEVDRALRILKPDESRSDDPSNIEDYYKK